MNELFQYAFFRYALAGLAIISIASAMIGTYIVTRRMVSISGASGDPDSGTTSDGIRW